jgi:hypothetical protein
MIWAASSRWQRLFFSPEVIAVSETCTCFGDFECEYQYQGDGLRQLKTYITEIFGMVLDNHFQLEVSEIRHVPERIKFDFLFLLFLLQGESSLKSINIIIFDGITPIFCKQTIQTRLIIRWPNYCEPQLTLSIALCASCYRLTLFYSCLKFSN